MDRRIYREGDIQTDQDGSEWLIVGVTGRDRISRVRVGSSAYHIHMKGMEWQKNRMINSKILSPVETETEPLLTWGSIFGAFLSTFMVKLDRWFGDGKRRRKDTTIGW
jgi:hypothetical protein